MKSNKILRVSKLINFFRISDIAMYINNKIYKKKYIRAINYHSTPQEYMSQFEEQLKFFSKHYSSVSKEDLKDFFEGKWKRKNPGLIISFDDGLESNYKYAKPLLEKYNFVGWFFIPSGLVESGNCKKEHLTGKTSERYMNWNEVRDLNDTHVIGSHTLTHKRLKKSLSEKVLIQEIRDSKIELEKMTNSEEVDVFCWVGGETEAYSRKASEIIKKTGYKFSFLTNHFPILLSSNTLQLERTNVEADWPIHLVKLYISPLMDFKYRKKRKLVKKIIQ
jgi:peptidoglycan/xylan/chitin deacetylase (PgdA/CDA1 family)